MGKGSQEGLSLILFHGFFIKGVGNAGVDMCSCGTTLVLTYFLFYFLCDCATARHLDEPLDDEMQMTVKREVLYLSGPHMIHIGAFSLLLG